MTECFWSGETVLLTPVYFMISYETQRIMAYAIIKGFLAWYTKNYPVQCAKKSLEEISKLNQ